MKWTLVISLFLLTVFNTGCTAQTDPAAEFRISEAADTVDRKYMSKEEWKEQLTDEEFHILREKGTEKAYSHPYWNNKKDGTYSCAACGLPLFDSDSKFKSGTGWPSFYKPLQSNHIHYENDRSYGATRVEVVCARCASHLGHVFKDGPEPTGLRYCLNGTALKFEEE